MRRLEQIDENTYKFNNLYIKKIDLDNIRKAVTNSVTDEKLHKIYNIMIKD